MNSAWTIEYSDIAAKQLGKLDRIVAKRIYRFMQERVAGDNGPRRIGGPLSGNLSEYWKYRVGDYRVICEIKDEVLVVLALKIDHRSDIYR